MSRQQRACILACNMNSARRRPIGVTLIALMFLWIGCFGTLVFPLVELSGGASVFWSQVLGSRIQSVTWIKALSYALDCLWFSLYVIYAVIGFGLWKLKNWARQSVLAISAAGVIAGIVVSFVFVRPILLGICVLGGIAVEFGWIAWYLLRPRVRYAFGAWNRYSVTGEWIEPPGLSKRGKQGVGILAVTSIGLLAVPPIFAVDAMMKNSDAYKLTMSTAQASPCVVRSLGSPIETGWLMTGGIEESDAKGSANLSIPVSGPKGKGNLHVQAKKLDGSWRINSLVFTHGTNRSNIIPSESTHDCD